MTQPVLQVEEVSKYFDKEANLIRSILNRNKEQIQAVDGVSLSLNENEVIGIIGESGCGKSTLLRTLIGLLSPTDGEIYFKRSPLSSYNRKDWKKFRKNVQIIFQDPFNSLDPKMTVKEILHEPLSIHNIPNKRERVEATLEEVELSPVDQYIDRIPSQLSGGEKQRVSIARALIIDPEVILADEPLSMLDVSTQASLLNLLTNLVDERDVAMAYISHDLSTVSYICDKINVMYRGRIVEKSPTNEIIEDPKHPYTEALIKAIPIPDPHHQRERTNIEGVPQEPVNIGQGCRFRHRCPEQMDICEKTPHMVSAEGCKVACHLYYDHEEKPDNTTENKIHDASQGEDMK